MPHRRSWFLACVVAATALCVLGAKLWLIREYGSPTPYMDQWNGEAEAVYLPHLRGELGWSHLWAPHNEHHIVWTRLLALGLLDGNGQWDPLLQMSVNAALHTLLAAALAAWFARRFRGGVLAAGVALVVALFALPVAWENTLAGFQSQFYFLALFALAHLALTLGTRPGGWRWWLGFACGVAGLGASSGGFAAPLASAATVAIGAALRRRADRWTWLHLALAGALTVAGVAAVRHVPGHDGLRANSVFQFAAALLNTAGWPANFWLPLGALVPAPFVWWAVQHWRARRLEPADAVLLGLGGWALLQCAAIAWSRGNLFLGGSPRYNDLFALTVVASAAALGRLVVDAAPAERPRVGRWAAAWLGLIAVGLAAQTREAYRGFLDPLQAEWRRSTALVADYVRGGDRAKFVALDQALLPYPDPAQLARWLDAPELRRVLPAAIRAPLALTPAPTETRGFAEPAENDRPADPGAVRGARRWRNDPRASAEFRSAPLPSTRLPVLQFRILGSAGLPDDALRLATVDGRTVETPQLGRWDGTRWQTANLPCPDEPVVVVARAPAGATLAFAEPVELGRWSWHNRQLLKAGRALFVGGALLLVLGASLAWDWRRKSPARPRAITGTDASPARPAPRSAWNRVAFGGTALVLFLQVWPGGWVQRLSEPAAPGFFSVGDPRLQPVDAFDVEGAPAQRGAIFTENPALAAHFWGTYVDGDAFTGRATSSVFPLARNRLYVPVLGYPGGAGLRLELQVLDDAGAPLATLPYTGLAPGERAQFWEIDVAAHRGGQARLAWADDNPRARGWLGVGRPHTADVAGVKLSRGDEAATNYLGLAWAAAVVAAIVAIPGCALRAWRPAWWPDGALLLPVPGLLALAGVGLVLWRAGLHARPVVADAYVLALAAAALALASRRTPAAPLGRVERWALGCYAAVGLGALALAVIPLPVAGEFYEGTDAQNRMVAAPPDSAIPYYTAAYFFHGKNGAESRVAYFGDDWSVTSRGPLLPLAINTALHVFRATPADPPEPAVAPWPAPPSGGFAARLVGFAANALVVLAAVHALRAFGAAPAALALGLGWICLAPLTGVNVVFGWPKLLAIAFVLLAVAELWRGGPSWRLGLWGALAWASHPVGALCLPAVWLLKLHRASRLVAVAGTGSADPRRFAALVATATTVLATLAWMSPWLAYKFSLGHPDHFLRYPLGDGRGFAVAENVASWLRCRWDNLWYTLVPGAFFSSDLMSEWLGLRLTPALRWTAQYAKTLPGELGLALTVPAYFAVLRGRAGVPGLARLHLVGTLFLVMWLYWGFSDNGLGRNCLEPLAACVIVLAALAYAPGPRVAAALAGALLLEQAWIAASGFAGAPGFAEREIPSAAVGLGAIWLLASAVPVVAAFRLALPAPPKSDDAAR